MVGIDRYSPKQTAAAPAGERIWVDLDGAVNDALLMRALLIDRFDFSDSDILLLRNEEAGRSQILAAFQRQLIDGASPGDVSLFYYAGHGSQVKNLASEEADQLDETLVPADAASGAVDIRDKEMARLYRAVLAKGASLTVVLDSCHSGGMARGVWNGAGKSRYLAPSPQTVNDPDRDAVTGKQPPDAAALGMLFLAAAAEDQPSLETQVEQPAADGPALVAHGAFTAALARVLQSPMANQSVNGICSRVHAILAGEGKAQTPLCAGKERDTRGLLGQPAGSGLGIVAVALGPATGGMVSLRGGSALGLAPGCTLVRAEGAPARVEIAGVTLASSEAKLLPPAPPVAAGDVFKLETWAAPAASSLRVYFARNAPGAEAVLAVARAIDQAAGKNVEIVSGLSPDSPTHVLYWNGGYFLERDPAIGQPVALGAAPDANALHQALEAAKVRRLWPILPPDAALASHIRLGAGTENPAVQIAAGPTDCVYFLAGRLSAGALEYSWRLKDARSLPPLSGLLPPGTVWKSAVGDLTDLALRLARIYGWINLEAPAGGSDDFPYRLVLERAAARPQAGGEAAAYRFGERLKFIFAAEPEALVQAQRNGGVSKRYVYVFVIDSSGEATCFFPDPANGNDGNAIPRGDSPAPRIEATRAPYDVQIAPPAGTDLYFMVSSREPLDPGTFQWAGVREQGGARRGAAGPLELLFRSVGEGTRGVVTHRPVPVTWSIQSIAVHSAP